MKVVFHTSIDCCQGFMPSLNQSWEQGVRPLVDDEIVVHAEQPRIAEKIEGFEAIGKVVRLRVFSCVWSTARAPANGGPLPDQLCRLDVELHLTSFWSHKGLPEFETFVKI
jgi:hypothetical protein